MEKVNALAIALLCFGLAACSQALVEQPSKIANSSQVVCRDIVPVGSHLKRRVCTTVANNELESERAKAVLAEAQQRQRDEMARERATRGGTPRGL